MGKEKYGYYVVLNNRDKAAYIVSSSDYGGVKRMIKSRLRNGFYRGSGRFAFFQELYDEDPGYVDVVGYDKRHRVFVENEVRSMGYRVMEDGELIKPRRKNGVMKVPEGYRGVVSGLIELLDSGKVGVREFEKYLEVAGEG